MKTTGVAAAAFAKWLVKNPVDGDLPFGRSGARYQVTRYCEYLAVNPWPQGNPLMDTVARDGAVAAYLLYLGMFAPPQAIERALVNLDHFYVFLGLGPVVRRSSMDGLPRDRREHSVTLSQVTSTA